MENTVKSIIPNRHLSSAAYIYFRIIYCNILSVSLGEDKNPDLSVYLLVP